MSAPFFMTKGCKDFFIVSCYVTANKLYSHSGETKDIYISENVCLSSEIIIFYLKKWLSFLIKNKSKS